MQGTALELGCDHTAYGNYASGQPSPETAWVISVGADIDSPGLRFKGDKSQPNEDGLLLATEGERVLLAVADAHFGIAASHELLLALLRVLSGAATSIPASAAELADLMRETMRKASESDADADPGSATTLLIAIYDRKTREGCGLSFGDSTFTLLGASGHRQPLGSTAADFVSLADPAGMDPDNADAFSFVAEPGDLLLAYTDGINECHYGQPQTSVTPKCMEQLLHQTGSDPHAYLRSLVELALAGVDENPGGQDNIAVVAARARATS